MLAFALRYASPVLLAIAPLFTYQFSLLDLLGYSADSTGSVQLTVGSWFEMSAPKPELEMRLRAGLTLLGIALLLTAGYFDAYLPSRSLRDFRLDYLDQVCKAEWRKKHRIRSDIRVNVMFLRWRLFVPFGRSFEMIWKDGFEPSDMDGNLTLFIWQGVCGKAARNREAAFIDLRRDPLDLSSWQSRWLCCNEFRLFPWQLKRTSKLTAILSIPLYDRRGPRGREREYCVGVINLDSKTDAGANHLALHTRDLAIFFAKHGQLIARMR